jgi:single-stranded-DNA-specific exonuclease
LIRPKYDWHVMVSGIIDDENIFKHILLNRGIDDADHFFSMGEESLHDPWLLSGMREAVERIMSGIKRGEKLLIYGDYDCDGISAIAVLFRTLTSLGAKVDFDLPDRFQDGYGLNLRAVQKIIDDKYDLVITVDNGITAIDEVKRLNDAGIDTIITDHHEDKGILPEAYAIIHAKHSPLYPFKDIAGVMTAYKLASALTRDKLSDLYDLVMIGTIADLMPLLDENQAMVNLGLKQLRKTKNLGLKKLLASSNIDLINETAIAFKIAPKINSSGRLGRAHDAVRLLVSESEAEVDRLIRQIEESHENRKELTVEALKRCEAMVDPNDSVIVVASKNLHEGVIGICAQKLAEKYQRSAIVITLDEANIGKGSMRSFADDNILEILKQSKDLLMRFGGHQQAAGLQIEAANIPILKQRLNQISRTDALPKLMVDMEIEIDTIRIATVKRMQDLSFFTATFLLCDLVVENKQLLQNKHTKLTVSRNGILFDALAFNSSEYYYRLQENDRVNIVGGLNINNWKNRVEIQVIIKDLECMHFQLLDYRDWDKQRLQEIGYFDDTVIIDDESIIKGVENQKQMTVVLTRKTLDPDLSEIMTKDFITKSFLFFKQNERASLSAFKDTFGIDPIIAGWIIAILIEVGLLTQTDEFFQIVEISEKKDLKNSPTYLKCFELKNDIEKLYSLPTGRLKNHYAKLMEDNHEL